MSTSLYINSLIRYDPETRCRQKEPNPFEFSIPSKEVNGWSWKRTPHSPNAYKGTGGFEVKLDALIIPVSIMATPEPFLMFEMIGNSNIDVGNMTKTMPNNALCQEIIEDCNCGSTFQLVVCNGVTGTCLVSYCNSDTIGCTGVSGAHVWNRCENSKKSSLKNTWVAHYSQELRDSTGTIIYYLYKSSQIVSVKDETWTGSDIKVRILDSTGVLIVPSDIDCANPCTYARYFCKENQIAATLVTQFEWNKPNPC